MPRKATLAATAAVLPLVLAAAGCGSSSTAKPTAATSASSSSSASSAATSTSATSATASNVGLSSADMNAAIQQATGAATALHLKGTIADSGSSISLNLQLNKASASGTIATGGTTIPFLAIGSTVYFQFTSSVLTMAGQKPTSAAGKVLLNKWISSKSSLASGLAGGFSSFTSLSAFETEMNSDDTLTAAGQTTLNGQTVAKYNDTSSDGTKTVLYVPASGPALPIEETGTGSAAGLVTFTWNQPTTVHAPAASAIYNG